MRSLGRHILVEFYDCDPAVLNDLSLVESSMKEAAVAAGSTIVDAVFRRFAPHGISGVVVIAESHLSIHTWPEYAYAAVDIFTCGDLISPDNAAAYLIREFESKSPSMVELKRGIIAHGNEKLPHKLSDQVLEHVI